MVSILSQRGGSLKCTSRPALLGGQMTMQSIRRLEKALDTSTRRVDELCAENERLRGLVRDLWARRDSLLDFGFYAEVAEQLDKLGIEVDE